MAMNNLPDVNCDDWPIGLDVEIMIGHWKGDGRGEWIPATITGHTKKTLRVLPKDEGWCSSINRTPHLVRKLLNGER
jgi:hypothetical protein